MHLDPVCVDALRALILGFALAGLLASTFEWVAARPPSLALLQDGGVLALASVPVLVFSAPFIILRQALQRRRFERPAPLMVAAATALAGFWSLACGRVVLDLAQAMAGA